MTQTLALQEVHYDEWRRGDDLGGVLRGEEITLERIAELVRALDADTRTQVILAADDEVPHLAIGGGDGRYIVEATWDNMEFHRAALPESDSRPEGPEVELVVGGQLGRFSPRLCVGLEEALAAAAAFATRVALAPELRWVTDD
jgi:hypothetical protein